jgi:hypothetical protein
MRHEVPPTHPACHGFPLIREGGLMAQKMNRSHGRLTQFGRKYVACQGFTVILPAPRRYASWTDEFSQEFPKNEK